MRSHAKSMDEAYALAKKITLEGQAERISMSAACRVRRRRPARAAERRRAPGQGRVRTVTARRLRGRQSRLLQYQLQVPAVDRRLDGGTIAGARTADGVVPSGNSDCDISVYCNSLLQSRPAAVERAGRHDGLRTLHHGAGIRRAARHWLPAAAYSVAPRTAWLSPARASALAARPRLAAPAFADRSLPSRSLRISLARRRSRFQAGKRRALRSAAVAARRRSSA